MSLSGIRILPTLVALMFTIGCDRPSVKNLSSHEGPVFGDWVDGGNKTLSEDETPDDELPPREEICDGRDNDQDGEIDEGTDGEDCTLPAEATGTTRCIGGVIKCTGCEPGTQYTEPCACGIDRVDTCDDQGVLHEGVCDSCSDPSQLPQIPCGFCGSLQADGTCNNPGECDPGDGQDRAPQEMWVRCDSCPEAETCGSTTCVGKKMVCAGDCTWTQVEGCAVRDSQCDQDSTRREECGNCGEQTMRCDGCFWEPASACDEGGVCRPGAAHVVPCGDQCGDGLGQRIECSDSCEWAEVGLCTGCPPGEIGQEIELCLDGHPACGQRIIETLCQASLDQDSCVSSAGEPSATGVVIQQCPTLECIPGQIQPGTCDYNGHPVPQNQVCGNDCTWLPPPATCGGSCECIPDEDLPDTTEPCGCGKTMTITTRCGPNCKWEQAIDDSECPQCDPAHSPPPPQQCDGGCGMRSYQCTSECLLSASDCQPKPNNCAAGEEITQSCMAECGSGQETLRCVGCSWVRQGDCAPDVPPACSPGQTEDPPGCPPACVLHPAECVFDGSSCSWTAGVCESPCG